ncbi:ExeA family protein [Roseovarius autotrophicus]|uniref:ExeA family protein n=1 Tax=Roseovarius autotrophicus TaxID=2824121 RepID=UPI0019E0167F|nr:AAA family ATPase [Roseovarius autotrophicus]MBE0454240.1 AAA family ATPase [Roseovarius sp.]
MKPEALYADFFGLSERPFTLLPDPSFLFWSKAHRNAYTILDYGIFSRAPITVVTGEIGSGKTTLVHHLIRNTDESVTIGLVSNAQGGRGELLQWVLNALSVEVPRGATYVQKFQKLQDFLIAEYAAERRVVLIFDEAQNLSIQGLEELRMLTNINANKDELIQLILVGQPELRDVIRSPRMRQLAQRVAASFHIPAMDAATVAQYIRHRLQSVGGTGQEFTDGACRMVHEQTGGVPRLVNQFCDIAMVYAWSTEQKTVTEDILQSVLEDGLFFAATLAAEESDAT